MAPPCGWFGGRQPPNWAVRGKDSKTCRCDECALTYPPLRLRGQASSSQGGPRCLSCPWRALALVLTLQYARKRAWRGSHHPEGGGPHPKRNPGSFKMTPGSFQRTPGSFGPRGPLQGPRAPLKGPRGPFEGPRGPFKGRCFASE